ncbi:CMRF35-like molecule 6 [Tupaia chinensis]|uniref:CMRF35-like molecule 6 n=1 Tax=Tupaia chinensis TaxID=246437 RepID=UPI0003C90A25|nr:CMRF35-like molecule 6 [Tupaia chinensis]
MTMRDGAAWLPSALLLLHVPGCFSLSGPSTATGTVGGSLSLQFRYQREFQADSKYWCRKSLTPLRLLCDKIVEIRGSQLEVRRGRVSIRDHPASLTFTVTLENLKEEDAGTYWSAIDRPWDQDTHVQVVVSVYPAPTKRSSPERPTLGRPTILPAGTWPTATRQDTSDPSPQSRPLPSSIHFLLLVFLKLPLLLSMLSAVLWMNRPWRTWGRRVGLIMRTRSPETL